MAPLQLQVAVLFCILLCCATTLVDADERPASTTMSNDSGSQSWGYVEVRKKAHMFWFYHRSPHRVSSAEKPWPTLLYAAPASTKHIRLEGLYLEHDPRTDQEEFNSWLRQADIIFVDTPVPSGFSYYDEDASPEVKEFSVSQMADDVVELLKDLQVQIPTLRCSPLILLKQTYDGVAVVPVADNVIRAILQRSLNLKVGGYLFWLNGKATIVECSSLEGTSPAEYEELSIYSTTCPSFEDIGQQAMCVAN